MRLEVMARLRRLIGRVPRPVGVVAAAESNEITAARTEVMALRERIETLWRLDAEAALMRVTEERHVDHRA